MLKIVQFEESEWRKKVEQSKRDEIVQMRFE